MRARTVLLLALVTLVCAAGAFALHLARPGPAEVPVAGAPVLPALAGRLDTVQRIAIETQAGPGAVLTRTADGWAVASVHGYPARTEAVNRLLVSLANLEKIAAKTADPARFRRLAVGDPADDPLARRVTLTGPGGGTLAELIVGKQRHEPTGRAASGTYVRVPGGDRAWLAAGLADLADDAYPFLERVVVDVPAGQVRRIAVARVDGGRLTAVRPAENAPALAIAGVPEGRQLDVAAVRRLGSALAQIKFDRVAPADTLDEATRVAVTRVTTFSGLQLDVSVFQRDGRFWLTLAATATAPEAKPQAAALAARTNGWAYMVADYVAQRLTRVQADVLAD